MAIELFKFLGICLNNFNGRLYKYEAHKNGFRSIIQILSVNISMS